MRAIGSDLHMDYTAVGQTTHLAARMEQLATPGHASCSPPTRCGWPRATSQVKPLGPGAGEGARASRSRSTSWPGPGPRAVAAAGGGRAGAHPLRRARRRAGAAPRRRSSGPRPGTARSWPSSGSPAWASRASSGSSPTRTAPQGWLDPREPARSPTARRRAYLPVIDLLKALLRRSRTATTPRDDPREGHGQAPDARPGARADACPALPGAARRAGRGRRSGRRSIRRSAASGRSTRSSACCCARARCSRCSSSSRTSTGSTPRPRRCSTAWSRACRPPGCCSSSTTGRSTSTRWGSKTYYRQLRLDPLPPESAEELLEALLGRRRRPSSRSSALLIERTEGNPFFLEESVRTLVETEALVGRARRLPPGAGPADASRSRRRCRRSWPRASTGSPPEDKRLLQAAAVIGKDVPFALLQAIAEVPEDGAAPRARATSRRPSSSTRRSLFPDLEYTFKHALTHEVAYGSLLQERRRALHARIVEAIERLYRRPAGRAGRAAGPPCPPRARCGRRRSRTSARPGAKAVGALGLPRGGRLLRAGARRARPSARDPGDDSSRRIDLRLDLRNALVPLGELGADARAISARPRRSAEALGDQRRLGLGRRLHGEPVLWITGELRRAPSTSAERALAIARDARRSSRSQVVADVLARPGALRPGDYRRPRRIFRAERRGARRRAARASASALPRLAVGAPRDLAGRCARRARASSPRRSAIGRGGRRDRRGGRSSLHAVIGVVSGSACVHLRQRGPRRAPSGRSSAASTLCRDVADRPVGCRSSPRRSGYAYALAGRADGGAARCSSEAVEQCRSRPDRHLAGAHGCCARRGVPARPGGATRRDGHAERL